MCTWPDKSHDSYPRFGKTKNYIYEEKKRSNSGFCVEKIILLQKTIKNVDEFLQTQLAPLCFLLAIIICFLQHLQRQLVLKMKQIVLLATSCWLTSTLHPPHQFSTHPPLMTHQRYTVLLATALIRIICGIDHSSKYTLAPQGGLRANRVGDLVVCGLY